MRKIILEHGDSLEILKSFDENSVDSVVTDPPYGLKFMAKKWDYDVPSIELWKEVLRVLKPGGHLLSFGGTRTYHRMVVNIEDAGFEIRDQIMWLYGSGFPKSLNISKSIDKKFGALKTQGKGFVSAGHDGRKAEMKQDLNFRSDYGYVHKHTTDLAKQWDGFGTALKPANEPIVMARKPLSEKTIVANVLKWGTGGINIDGCRVEVDSSDPNHRKATGENGNSESMFGVGNSKRPATLSQGRFPANIILDEEAGALLDEQSGESQKGGASRFFYCAKAGKKERGPDNNHPTVKPIKLMSYLVRLVTPPSGIVLDPFMGSGSTGIAAKNEGFGFIGIEREAEYIEIARHRIGN